MNILQVLPRRMRFDVDGASSVELCVADWVAGSRFRNTTAVVAERSENEPIVPVEMLRLAPAKRLRSWRGALEIAFKARRRPVDLIVVQQVADYAAAIATVNRAIPVVLQNHNFVTARQPDDPKAKALVARWMRKLAGITLISETTLDDFNRNWPAAAMPRAVVCNGFDFSLWNPAPDREKLIVASGRVQAEKGLIEAAEGTGRFLADHPDWRALFLLSATGGWDKEVAAIRAGLAPAGERGDIRIQEPFSTVRSANERAAIVVVPSKWIEPFGRTALEAHAGGAALVSSGTGGLREISGDAALYLEAVTPDAIQAALRQLAGDEAERERLGRAGAQRARGLFPLVAAPGAGHSGVCERLDAFYETVVEDFRRRRRG